MHGQITGLRHVPVRRPGWLTYTNTKLSWWTIAPGYWLLSKQCDVCDIIYGAITTGCHEHCTREENNCAMIWYEAWVGHGRCTRSCHGRQVGSSERDAEPWDKDWQRPLFRAPATLMRRKPCYAATGPIRPLWLQSVHSSLFCRLFCRRWISRCVVRPNICPCSVHRIAGATLTSFGGKFTQR